MTSIHSPKVVRMTSTDRRTLILDNALELSGTLGFNNFTSVKLSQAMNCGHGIIFHYFSTMDLLRDAVMELAIERKNLKVLLDGLTCRNAVALAAPEELKDLAKALLD